MGETELKMSSTNAEGNLAQTSLLVLKERCGGGQEMGYAVTQIVIELE